MTAVSTTFQLSVVAPAQTVVGAIAQEMAAARPTGAMWSTELSTASSRYLAASHPLRDPSAPLMNDPVSRSGGGAQAGSLSAYLGYNNGQSQQLLMGKAGPYKGHWDTGFSSASGYGAYVQCYGTTGWYDYSQTISRYDPSEDQFRCWSASGNGDSAGALWPGYGDAHNFGMSCIDSQARRIYRVVRPLASLEYWLARTSLDNPHDPSAKAVFGPFRTGGVSTHPPAEFIPGMGAAGSVIILDYGSSGTGRWWRFDVATETFSQTLPNGNPTPNQYTRTTPALCYYNGFLYWAHGDDANQFLKMDSAGTISSAGTTPVRMSCSGQWQDGNDAASVEVQHGVHTEIVPLNGQLYAFRPGHLRIDGATYPLAPYPDTDEFQYGGVYRYDPSTETWDNGGAPVDTFDVWENNATYGLTDGETELGFRVAFSAAPIESLGVVFIAQQWSLTEARAFLWKPPA